MRISPINLNTSYSKCRKPCNNSQNLSFGTVTPEAERVLRNFRASEQFKISDKEYEEYMDKAKGFDKDFAHFHTKDDGHVYVSTNVSADVRGFILRDRRLQEMEDDFEPIVECLEKLQYDIQHGIDRGPKRNTGTEEVKYKDDYDDGKGYLFGGIPDWNTPWDD